MADEMLTLREAARQIGRSSGTLRRYIKSGRLPAEKHRGKFGIEYRIRGADLDRLRGETRALPARVAAAAPGPAELAELLNRFVPVSVYNELAEKHERLLVEFGMLRGRRQEAIGETAVARLDSGREASDALERKEREIRDLRDRSEEELDFLRRHLRESEQEVRERDAEVVSLRERVNRLEQGFLEGAEPAAGPGRARLREKVDRLREWLDVCERESTAARGT